MESVENPAKNSRAKTWLISISVVLLLLLGGLVWRWAAGKRLSNPAGWPTAYQAELAAPWTRGQASELPFEQLAELCRLALPGSETGLAGGYLLAENRLADHAALREKLLGQSFAVAPIGFVLSPLGFPALEWDCLLPTPQHLRAMGDSARLDEWRAFASARARALGIEVQAIAWQTPGGQSPAELLEAAHNSKRLSVLLELEAAVASGADWDSLTVGLETWTRAGLAAVWLRENPRVHHQGDSLRLAERLRSELGFTGLVILENSQQPWDERLRGVSLVASDLAPAAFADSLRRASERGHFPMEQAQETAFQLAWARAWLGEPARIEAQAWLPTATDSLLFDQIKLASICLLPDTTLDLPFAEVWKRQGTLAQVGAQEWNLAEKLAPYVPYGQVLIDPTAPNWPSLPAAEHRVVVLQPLQLAPERWAALLDWLAREAAKKPLAIVNFQNDSILPALRAIAPVVQLWGSGANERAWAMQALYGGVPMLGQMPNSAPKPQTRLRWDAPLLHAGIDPRLARLLDSLAQQAVAVGATAGIQIFAAKDGIVLYDKAFGTTKLRDSSPVSRNTLFDLASVTKIAAATLAAMRMIDLGKMSLSTTLESCFKDTRIDYTRIKADTLVRVDTLPLAKASMYRALIQRADTFHLGDTSFVAIDTMIFRPTPELNVFKIDMQSLLRHESGVNPTLPILPYYFFRARYPMDQYRITQSRYDRLMDSLRTSPFGVRFPSAALSDSLERFPEMSDSLLAPLIDSANWFHRYFSFVPDSGAAPMGRNLYLRASYRDSIWNEVKQIPIFYRKVAQYADMNMLLLQQAIDSLNGMSIDRFNKAEFYEPLGMGHTTFQPLNHFELSQIAATEDERIWRGQVLHGHVHDPTAAMFGGLAGNAGLFSTAHDLGILAQMWLNGGVYGNRRYLSQATLELFTSRQPGIERGLGFDMKGPDQSLMARSASERTYGHTGFTGTCIWVDPDSRTVFVFISNRLQISAFNWAILPYLRAAHQAIYDCMI